MLLQNTNWGPIQRSSARQYVRKYLVMNAFQFGTAVKKKKSELFFLNGFGEGFLVTCSSVLF